MSGLRYRLFALLMGVLAVAVAVGGTYWSRHKRNPESVRAELSGRSLQFFLDNANPRTGMVRDKAHNFADETPSNNVASIASTGFGLAVITHAATHGTLSRPFGEEYCTKTLRFARDHVARKFGWFNHWVDWDTGKPLILNEYSTIDSAIFLAGALYAAQLYPRTECASLANELYRDADFIAAMTEGGLKPGKRTLNMAYVEGKGWTTAEWNMYAEQKLLLILGLGHPTNPLPDATWLAFSREVADLPKGGGQVMGLTEALFVHQYSEVFIDFRAFNDGYPNYHANGINISRYQRQLARENQHRSKTLSQGFWGFSAGESPTGYSVYSALSYGGTVCLSCALGSLSYMPEEILGDVAQWLSTPYKNVIWGRYGLVDSLDLDQNWVSKVVLGITVGPVYMNLANLSEDTSIWKDFMAIPAVRLGMDRASKAHLRLTERSTASNIF